MHKILIVEDNASIAGSMHKHLTAWNYDAQIVEDFNGVLEQFKRFQHNLVLMDIGLPMFDGY